MNKLNLRIIMIFFIIGIILASGCLRRQGPEKPVQQTPIPQITNTPVSREVIPGPSFPDVKAAVLYETVTDGAFFGRSNDDVVKLLKLTKSDLIFRGFWRWRPVVESRNSAKEQVSKLGGSQKEVDLILKYNYTYEDLALAISGIKQEMPDMIFVGAIPAQRIDGIEIDDMTGEILDRDQTWEMAFDPSKWGIDITKKEAQKQLGDTLGWNEGFAYYPDMTNPKYQQLLLDMAKKQIDCGADAIWIDMLFSQAVFLSKYTKNPNHQAVKESFEASSKIVDEIHAYGKSKGKNVYVGTWGDTFLDSYTMPKLDFVTLTPTSDMIKGNNLNKKYWDEKKNNIVEKLGDVKIFVFIDWGTDVSPLATFSQELSKSDQIKFIQYAHKFFKDEGMIFVLPLHGGFMGNKASLLSFGDSKVYDSQASQFGTFNAIEDIAITNP